MLTINNCVFTYGKYIEAFKPNFLSSYSLVRVNNKENVEYIENTTKDELEEDEKRKQLEIVNLGYLTNSVLDPSDISLNKSGGISGFSANNSTKNNVNFSSNAFNFNSEINAIEEKVRVECIKVYTGEFAKILNNNSKIPNSLLLFLQNLKNEMETFRLKCVRDLRTYVRNILILFNNHYLDSEVS